MACACNAKKDKAAGAIAKPFTVKKPNGTTYGKFSTKIEAQAAAKRIGGKCSTC